MGSEGVTHLVFGVVAAALDGQASAAFDELAAWMRANDDVEIERKSFPAYRGLAESVREGTSDIAWLPPVVYARLAEGVTPLGYIARGGITSYSAALVTREDSKLHALADLEGSRAGWVDPWSAAGYVLPRIELARAGIDPAAAFLSEKFYGTHRDTLLALARGECDVAGTYDGAWSAVADLRVRVIATFGKIPSDVIAVRRNLPPAQYERALGALRHACLDAKARPLVRAVFGGEDLREGTDPEHDALRVAFERATANGVFD